MIKYEARYFNNAHRISDVPIDAAVTVLQDGQWMSLSATGTAVISDGAVNKKSYMTLSSMWGALGNGIGVPITAMKTGRDNVSSTGTVSLLMGPFRVATDQYDSAQTFVSGGALKVYDGADATKAGMVTPLNIVGVKQALSNTVLGAVEAAGAGNAIVTVTAVGMPNSPKAVTVAVANNDTAAQAAAKFATGLAADANVGNFFVVSVVDATVTLTARTPAANDATMAIAVAAGTSTGLTPTAATVATKVAGVAIDSPLKTVGYVFKVPANADDTLTLASE